MIRTLIVCVVLWMTTASTASAGIRGFFIPREPGTVYRYPLFREGNRPEHVRQNAGDAYRRYSPYQLYPKYYGGFHTRDFYRIGTPPGDHGFRGTPW